MRSTATLSLILALFLGASLPSQAAMANSGTGSSAQSETDAVGVVDEINPTKGIVTISHEPIKSLDWPAMTMDFTVQDKKLLGKMAKGKKIHFAFVEHRGNYLITRAR